MHGSGIDGDEQMRASNQSRQRKQIRLSREVDESLPRALCNFRDVRLFIERWATRQNKIGFGIFAEMINDLCPSRSLPKLFPSSRAGMQIT